MCFILEERTIAYSCIVKEGNAIEHGWAYVLTYFRLV